MAKGSNGDDSSFWTLAIETSVMTSSVALMDGLVVQAERTVRTARGHASKLLPMVEAILLEAKVSPQELGLIVVPVGPGSFTGIRIGISTAKGLGWSLGVPLVGVCSLESLAAGTGQRDIPVVSVLDARKGEVFMGAYQVGSEGRLDVLMSPIVAPPASALEQVNEVLEGRGGVFVGEGIRAYPDTFADVSTLAPSWDVIRAVVMGRIGKERFEQGGAASAEQLQPIYLRRSDAEIQVGLPTGTRKTVILE